LVAACGGAQDRAVSHASAGLETALGATNAARDSLVAWDKDAQGAIVARATSEEDGKSALDRYRGARARVVEVFADAYAAIAVAATALALYDAGKANAAEVVAALTKVGTAVKEANDAYKALRGL
jgi:hypothetical protein